MFVDLSVQLGTRQISEHNRSEHSGKCNVNVLDECFRERIRQTIPVWKTTAAQWR